MIQKITIKGFLAGCAGGEVAAAKYTARLETAGPVSCESLSLGESATGTIVVKWKHKGEGESVSTISMPLSEPRRTALQRQHRHGSV